MKLTKFKLYYLNQALGYEWCDETGWHHSINELKDQVFDGVLPNDRVNGEVIRAQFTGLVDKDNNEIYEGDIIEYFDWCYASAFSNDKIDENIKISKTKIPSENSKEYCYHPLIGEVKWDNKYSSYKPLIFSQEDYNGNCFNVVCGKGAAGSEIEGYPKSYVKIIGNKYENSELLKQI